MRKLLAAGVTVAALGGFGMATAGSAAAHVHGITPLECTPANANAGAVKAVEVSPRLTGLQGLIPSQIGSSPLQPGDGGNDAAACDH